MHRLPSHALSPGFRAVSLRPHTAPMGHVLNVDHFFMSQPTFPPHPHAGFSAVTWMAPWSAGGFINRDSLGDRTRIGPGALHWTRAGAGMHHEELPEHAGLLCEGLQIFVKMPEALELDPPRAFHVEPAAMPTLRTAGGVVSVLVGAVGAAQADIPADGDTTMAHVRVEGGLTIEVPTGTEAFLLGLRGEGEVDGQAIGAHMATALRAGPVALRGAAFDALIGWSAPMPRAPRFQGPFCMFSPDRLAEAQRRAQTGGMGALSPSKVAWARG
ncbi:MAG: hypothetical protein RL071_3691 [Pseudomonadota bacterium]|jgi:redox-sensitive bicupin YhaK (pirin superfamily)